MKDETFFPPARNLRVATSKHATGPYGPASPSFTAMDTEGPSILHSGDWWYVYYDEYTRGHYGAVRTKDFEHFDLVTDSLRTPRGIRHGSAFLAPQSVLNGLLALDSAAAQRLRSSAGLQGQHASRRQARQRPDRAHDARREVLAALHDAGRSRQSGERLVERRVRIAGSPPGDATSDSGASGSRQDQRHPALLHRETRLGIPIIPFEEALHGLYGEGATSFPQAIGLAATWDTSLMGRVATAIARETRSRGIRDVLSPVVNIASDVRWGRTEETYGEDPFLSSAMAVAFVTPFEKNGVITTPKHFVANVGDGGRDSYPIQYSERLLEETYYPPFEAAIHQGGARSVMSAYNSVDGQPATQNHALLTDS